MSKKQKIGVIHFDGKIDITDPCYNRDVWCRMNDVPIAPGDYLAWFITRTETDVYDMPKQMGDGSVVYVPQTYTDTRVGKLGITRLVDGKPVKGTAGKCIGNIGVDAGMAGFFQDKPDFTDGEWIDFCNGIRHMDYASLFGPDDAPTGVFSHSGYGDGGYDVYAHTNDDGQYDALEIRFL